MTYLFSFGYAALIIAVFLFQGATVSFLVSSEGFRPNFLPGLLVLGFIVFSRVKMVFFIILTAFLLEISSLLPFGFYFISYLLAFSFLFFYYNQFLFTYYNFLFFMVITFLLKAIIELNLMLFFLGDNSVLAFMYQTAFYEYGINALICLLSYFVLNQLLSFMKIKKI